MKFIKWFINALRLPLCKFNGNHHFIKTQIVDYLYGWDILQTNVYYCEYCCKWYGDEKITKLQLYNIKPIKLNAKGVPDGYHR